MNTGNAKSRGYSKIKSAASAFNFDFKGKIVLDIGSSTGGFTEYTLEHGARKVIAIEKGTNQMKSPLRDDPRVELHEKTDIFGFRIAETPSEGHSQLLRGRSEELREDGRDERPSEGVSVILADVSFLSLTKVLKYAKLNLSRSNTDFLVMLKPQFEAEPKDLRNGIVKNETVRRKIIKCFEQWLKANGFLIVKKHDNDTKGKHGNIERFYWLKQEKK